MERENEAPVELDLAATAHLTVLTSKDAPPRTSCWKD